MAKSMGTLTGKARFKSPAPSTGSGNYAMPEGRGAEHQKAVRQGAARTKAMRMMATRAKGARKQKRG